MQVAIRTQREERMHIDSDNAALLDIIRYSEYAHARLAAAEAIVSRADLLSDTTVVEALAGCVADKTQAIRSAGVRGLADAPLRTLLAATAAMPDDLPRERMLSFLFARADRDRDSAEQIEACADSLVEMLGDRSERVRSYAKRLLLKVPMVLLRRSELALDKLDVRFLEHFVDALGICASAVPTEALAGFASDLRRAERRSPVFRDASQSQRLPARVESETRRRAHA